MNKKQLSERDICTKYITPALEQAGWDVTTQVREEFPLTRGRVIVRGKLHTRARHKRADYVPFYKPNIPNMLAITNGIDVPSHIRHDNPLSRPLKDYGPSDRVDLIITNPPFGGMEEDGEVKVNHCDPEELMAEYQQIVHQLEAAQQALKAELMACLGGKA